MSSVKNASMSSPMYDVVVMEEAPFVMVENTNGGKSYSGFVIELLEMISKRAHFRHMINLTDHTSYGYQDHDGKLRGLISEVANKKADLAVGPIPITSQPSVADVVDFTKPFMSSNIKLLIKIPPSLPEVQRGIHLMLQPFTAEVWVMICLAFIVISLALFLIGRFSPSEWARVPKEKDPRMARTSFGLKNSFLFACSTLGWQGYREAPRSIAGRILMCMWLMFTVFVMVAYTASLAAMLTTRVHNTPQQVPLPFSSYEDIVENKKVKLGALKYGHVYTSLKLGKATHSGILSQLYTYIDETHDWIQKTDEGVQRVRDSGGKYALLMETVKAEYVTTTKCDLITYGESLTSFGYGFAAPEGSPLMDRINLAILHLRENGELHRLFEKYMVQSNKCPFYDKSKLTPHKEDSSSPNAASSMDMRDMAIPFLFLFLGILGAGGALGAELFYRKHILTKRDPDNKARQPLNTESGISKAPKTSPPPPPIYKVVNKLQDSGREKDKEKKMACPPPNKPEAGNEKDVEKSSNSIEMVQMDDKVEADRAEDTEKEDKEVEVEVIKEDNQTSEDKAEVINEVA